MNVEDIVDFKLGKCLIRTHYSIASDITYIEKQKLKIINFEKEIIIFGAIYCVSDINGHLKLRLCQGFPAKKENRFAKISNFVRS